MPSLGPQASVRNLVDAPSTLLGTRDTNQTGRADEAHTLPILPWPSRGEALSSPPPFHLCGLISTS